MRRRSLHLLLIGVLALPLIVAAIIGIWLGLHRGEPDGAATAASPSASLPASPPAPRATTVPEPPAAERAAPPPTPPETAKEEAEPDAAVAPATEPLDTLEAGGWEVVDLEAVRAAMPGNLYWTMSAPTKDEAILAARAAERDRWNVEYGKVLSNTATAEEVDAYYLHRKRLSSDYVEFATHLLVHYGAKLPKRDVGLLKLAIDMHLARLEEIPRQLAEAHERRIAHDVARRAWLEEQKAFDAPNVP
jgi:hypothetical protein